MPIHLSLTDICMSNPDDKIIFMYVASLFIALPHDQHTDVSTPDSEKTSLTHLRLPTGSRSPSRLPERQLRSPNKRTALSLIVGLRWQRGESPTCDGVLTIMAEAGSVRRSDSADTVVLLKGKAVTPKVRTRAVKVTCRCLFVCLWSHLL
jgi:hypothetical protein